jgi:hypothetical protein
MNKSTMTQMDIEAERILKALEASNEVERQLLPSLPEGLFSEVFVPFFKGEIKDPEVEADLLSKWITLARHPMGEINILDNTTGEVKFTVPSIFYSKMFDPTKADTTGSFKDLLTMANQLAGSNPYRAQNYLDNDLQVKFAAMRQKGHLLTKEQDRWAEILKKYDSSNPLENEKLNQNQNNVSTNLDRLEDNITDDDLVDD